MSTPLLDLQVAIQAEGLPTQAELVAWVEAVLSHPSVDTGADSQRELTARLVDSDESQALNRDYRGRDKPTNVLSFPFENPPGVNLPLLGDLVICHPVVCAEAREQEKSLRDHYAHMVVHGTLHLLGHDHIEDAEAELMEGLEREILATLGIDDPYLADRQCANHQLADHPSERPDQAAPDTEDKRADA
ncbi:rRNA maturation RNase YbeY [Halomonas urumqiensis]|uniref:Endoribonuclease YbeY n=1 Tax=Halomonas urumqiensis TaxID=1684789 RepID=A0A2N7UHK3_9GAMM|nr:rRNA maturation RNase YbeY [Halomonas urumqiensis]PMR79937.1 rRNA maturation RNase YbeY [Halomonas urumqiensis]PTB02038.1 rRNA maturation RNase YbeY [Halomonas urumqiensis]GHE21477.1 endoribonuclease YbeY [Halomonas urumqiensis]